MAESPLLPPAGAQPAPPVPEPVPEPVPPAPFQILPPSEDLAAQGEDVIREEAAAREARAIPDLAEPTRLIDLETGEETLAEDPSEAVRSGRFGFAKGAPVFVLNEQTGQVEAIEDPEADQDFLGRLAYGQAQGYRFATFDEQRAAKLEAADDENLLSALEGVGRSLSFGVSDRVVAQFADDPSEYLKQAQIRRQANPIASGIGEFGTDLATAVLSGGTSLLGKAAAKTASGFAAKQAAKAAAKASGGSVVKRLATEGAIEGAAMGLREEIIRTGLAEEELTAENVAGTMLEGTAMGAAFGLGLGAATKGVKGALSRRAQTRTARLVREAAAAPVPKLDRDAIKLLARQSGQELADDAADKLSRAMAVSKAERVRHGIDRAVIRASVGKEAAELFDSISSNPAAMRAIFDADDVVKARAPKLAENLTELRKLNQAADSGAARGVGKLSMLDRIKPNVSPEVLSSRIDDVVRRLDETAEQFLFDRAGQWKGTTAHKALGRVAEKVRRIRSGAGSAGKADLIDIYANLEEAKRQIGVGVASLEKRDFARAAELRSIYQQDFLGLLEDASLWGDDLVEAVRPYNRAWSDRIAAESVGEIRGGFELSGDGAKALDWKPKEFKIAAAEGLVKAPTADAVAQKSTARILRWADRSVKAAEAKAAAGSQDAAEALPALRDVRERIAKEFADAEQNQKFREAAAELADRAQTGRYAGAITQVFSPVSSAVAGGFAGGPAGAAAGLGLSAAARRGLQAGVDPLLGVRTRYNALKRALGNSFEDLANNPAINPAKVAEAKRTVKITKAAGKSIRSLLKGKNVLRQAPRAAAALAVRERSFEKDASEVVDGNWLIEGLTPQENEAASAYLVERLPPEARPATPGGRVRKASLAGSLAWLREKRALEAPEEVFEVIGAGGTPAREAAAIRAVFPELMDQYVTALSHAANTADDLTPVERGRIKQLLAVLGAGAQPPQAAPPQVESAATPPTPSAKPGPAPNVDLADPSVGNPTMGDVGV